MDPLGKTTDCCTPCNASRIHLEFPKHSKAGVFKLQCLTVHQTEMNNAKAVAFMFRPNILENPFALEATAPVCSAACRVEITLTRHCRKSHSLMMHQPVTCLTSHVSFVWPRRGMWHKLPARNLKAFSHFLSGNTLWFCSCRANLRRPCRNRHWMVSSGTVLLPCTLLSIPGLDTTR